MADTDTAVKKFTASLFSDDVVEKTRRSLQIARRHRFAMVAHTELVRFASWFLVSLVGHVLLRLVWGAVAAQVIGKAKWVRRTSVSPFPVHDRVSVRGLGLTEPSLPLKPCRSRYPRPKSTTSGSPRTWR